MPWSVQTWVPGDVATPDEPAHSVTFAHDLAQFIHDVRGIPTRGRTFRGSGRGGHLPDHDAWVATCLERSRSLLDVEPLRRLWAQLRDLPANPGGHVMTPGDLTPGQRPDRRRAPRRRHRRRRSWPRRPSPRPGRRMASARHGSTSCVTGRPGQQRSGVGARRGLGAGASPRRHLVLRRHQPRDEFNGPTHTPTAYHSPSNHRIGRSLWDGTTLARGLLTASGRSFGWRQRAR